jgi:1,5-anhydro-D-fructose reductase (1,5-anhydro-D-mannitol-forming)
MSDVRWGFIGASTWAAECMIPAVHAVPGARPVSIFSTSDERGQRFARECGLERSYSSLADFLADPDIDAVYVSTTNDLHAAQTIAAAHAGKHVLCEKPLAITFDDALRMREACRDAPVVLGTNHHIRGGAAIRAMRQALEDGVIGELIAARVFHAISLPEEMRTWRLNRPGAGAGVLLDLTVHSVDTIRFLIGDEITEVLAMTANQGLADKDIEDSVMGVMRTTRGALVMFHDAFSVAHAGTGVELHGTTGSLIGRDVLSSEPGGDVFLRRGDAVSTLPIPKRWPLYERAIERFNGAVRGEGTPLTSADDGIASLAVALAASKSARAGGAVAIPADWRQRA